MSSGRVPYLALAGLIILTLAACPLPASRTEMNETFFQGRQQNDIGIINTIAVLPGMGNSPYVEEATAYFTFLLKDDGRFGVVWPYNVEETYRNTGGKLDLASMSSRQASEAGRLTGADAVVFLIFNTRKNPGEYAAPWSYTWAAASLIDSNSGAFIANCSVSNGTFPEFRQAEKASIQLFREFGKILDLIDSEEVAP